MTSGVQGNLTIFGCVLLGWAPSTKSIEPNRPGTHSVYTGQPPGLRFELAFVLVRRQPRFGPEMERAHGHDHGLLDGADAAPSISDACFPAQAGNPLEKSRRQHVFNHWVTGSIPPKPATDSSLRAADS